MSGRGADIWSSAWGYLLSSMGQISVSVVWSTYLVDKLSDIWVPTHQISACPHPGRISVPVVAQIFGHIWSLPQISECRHQISGCTPTSDGSRSMSTQGLVHSAGTRSRGWTCCRPLSHRLGVGPKCEEGSWQGQWSVPLQPHGPTTSKWYFMPNSTAHNGKQGQ